MPSPFVTVQDGAGAPQATTNGANVTPGNTVTVALVSNAGVNTWALLCVYSDEQNVPATVNAGLSVNALTKIATFPAPAIGSALIFQSQINQGQNAQFQNDPTLTTTFGVFALTSGGFRVAALNETYEGNGTYGWIAKLNAIFRAGSIAVTWANDLLGSSSSSQTVVKLSSASAIPVTTALSFGTNPAGTGALRLANALAIKGRNQANALDMSLLATNSSNQVLLGDIGFASVLQGLSIAGVVGGTTLLSLAGASGDFLKLGAPTATGSAYSSAGLLRIGDVNGTAITILSGRNATNTADQTLISSDGSGNVFYDGGSAQTFLRGNISATIGIPGSYNLSIANNGQISTYGGAGFRVTNNASGFIFNSDSSLPNWTFQINAASILSMGALGSGTNVLQLFDGTAPTSAPSGSSYLYSTSGVLKYRGSSGKIWTIGAIGSHERNEHDLHDGRRHRRPHGERSNAKPTAHAVDERQVHRGSHVHVEQRHVVRRLGQRQQHLLRRHEPQHDRDHQRIGIADGSIAARCDLVRVGRLVMDRRHRPVTRIRVPLQRRQS